MRAERRGKPGHGPGSGRTALAIAGPVLARRGGRAKTLATVRATERLLARVGAQVRHQGRAPGKTPSAHVATVTLACSGDGVGTEWGVSSAGCLGWSLQALREPSRRVFQSLQPRRLSFHRKDLLRCLSPFSLSFPVLFWNLSLFRQTLFHLRTPGIRAPQVGPFLHPDEGWLSASEPWENANATRRPPPAVPTS